MTKKEDKNRLICSGEYCNKTYIKDSRQLPICNDCNEFLVRMLYWIPKVRVEPAKAPSGLVLPNQQGARLITKG